MEEVGLDAEIMTPTNTDVTCLQGKGTLIDYAVVSRKMKPYVQEVKADFAVPWAPHVALRVKVIANANKVTVKTLVKPKIIKILIPSGYPPTG